MTIDSAAMAPALKFAKSPPFFDELGAAGQRLWFVLWQRSGFGTQPVKITDRELAELCERGIRWVQKGLKQLCDFCAGEAALPFIARFFEYGPRSEAGRRIAITLRFVEPSPGAGGATTKARNTRGRPAGASPAPSPAAPAPAADEPPVSPEDQEEARRIAEEFRRSIHREARRAEAKIARKKGRLEPEDLEPPPAPGRSLRDGAASKLGALIGRPADEPAPADPPGPPENPSGP